MQTDCTPSADYPCMDCESAAEAQEIHPFFDRPSWQDGFTRGDQEGYQEGEHLATKALRTDVLQHLARMAGDMRLGFRHDLETPLAVVCQMTRLVEDLMAE